MNEIKMILACQNGDKQAFYDLIEFYYPYISKFLLKLTADETISEDLTQDTFVKFIRHVDRFDVYGKASLATYLITIAKNCYIDYLRSHKNVIVNVDDLKIADTTAESRMVKKLEISDVLKVVDALPEEQAQAIKLKYLEQLTLKEIADEFNTNPQTIKSRIHSGMVKLRKSLIKGGNQDG